MTQQGSLGAAEDEQHNRSVTKGRFCRLIGSVRQLPPRGVVAVISSFALHISLGGGYAFGNLTTYMTSYLHLIVGEDVGYAEAIWVGVLLFLVSAFTYLPGALLYRRVGPRPAILAASLLMTGSVALTRWTVKKSLVWVTVTYGVLTGAGTGLLFIVPMLVSQRWFPRHAGLVSGMVMAGSSMGGTLFTIMQTGYLNPGNVSPQEDGFFHDRALLQHVPDMFLVEAVAMIALQLSSVVGISDPPLRIAPHSPTSAKTPQHPEGSTAGTQESVPEIQPVSASDSKSNGPDKPSGSCTSHDDGPRSCSLREAMRRWEMYFLIFMYGIVKASGTIIGPLWKAYGQTFVKDDYFLAMVGSGCSLFSILGQPAWGCLCDRLGFKITIGWLSVILGVLCFSFTSTPVGGKAMLMVWVWSMHFTFSGLVPTVMAGTVEAFGAGCAGVIFSTNSLISTVPFPLAGLLYNVLQNRYGYTATFVLAGTFSFLGLAAALAVGGRAHRGKDPSYRHDGQAGPAEGAAEIQIA